MATGQNRVPKNLKEQLALAVRSIQWSYAIFWAVSATQPGALEWGDGYYNGDIKTRKTIQAVELKADQLELQRSEQLRDLYESLSASESTVPQQTRRSSTALSPEDLTDTEWYYLVCMSFVFNTGEGMPGRTLARGETIWLCNAHYADSQVFSRSLLAKSAAIQTVVCFPFLGGVVELGTTDQVIEDLNLVPCVKASFLESPYGLLSNISDHQEPCEPQLDDKYVHVIENEDLPVASLEKTSNEFDPDHEVEDSFMVEGINGGASQVQSWQFMDEEFSNCVHHSLNSSDCISQTLVEPSSVAFGPRKGRVQETGYQHLGQIQERNQARMTSLDLRSIDLHYQGILSMLFKTTHRLILGPHVQNCGRRSSFMSWKKEGLAKKVLEAGNNVMSQKMIKKVLFEVPRMHQSKLLDSLQDNGVAETDEITNHVLSERKRREKLNERFMILRSIVPSISKVDKVSILDDTIEYLQKLERRLQELESCRESTDTETIPKRKKSHDARERTAANCGNNETRNQKTTVLTKRKASEIDEEVPETDDYLTGTKECLTDHLTVRSVGNELVIEMRCGWREGVLLEIMDAVSNLNLDSHSVQSSTRDGILCLTIKCKQKRSKVAAAGKIKHALQRVAWKT